MTAWRTWGRQVAATASSCSAAALRRFSREALAATLSLVYPPRCPFCNRYHEDGVQMTSVCSHCSQLLLDRRPACSRCARPLPKYGGHEQIGCGPCRTRRLRWRFDQAVALGVYEAERRQVVLQMKQAGNESLVISVGRLLADRIAERTAYNELHGAFDLVAPTPMHWLRRLRRGESCAELLASSIATGIDTPLDRRLLRCRRNPQKQGLLLPTERRRNVRRAYQVTRGRTLTGAHVLLVDDVMTTGATANELARVLRRAGANRITLAVVARGIGFD